MLLLMSKFATSVQTICLISVNTKCLIFLKGEHSKITLATRNVFIEVTATDLTKVSSISTFCVMTLCMFGNILYYNAGKSGS